MPWHWPSTGSVIDDVPDDVLKVIKSRIGGCRENAQAKDWAGHVIAQALGLEMDDPDQKGKVKAMLKAWIARGDFTVETATDHMTRQLKKIIVVKGAATPEFC